MRRRSQAGRCHLSGGAGCVGSGRGAGLPGFRALGRPPFPATGSTKQAAPSSDLWTLATYLWGWPRGHLDPGKLRGVKRWSESPGLGLPLQQAPVISQATEPSSRDKLQRNKGSPGEG